MFYIQNPKPFTRPSKFTEVDQETYDILLDKVINSYNEKGEFPISVEMDLPLEISNVYNFLRLDKFPSIAQRLQITERDSLKVKIIRFIIKPSDNGFHGSALGLKRITLFTPSKVPELIGRKKRRTTQWNTSFFEALFRHEISHIKDPFVFLKTAKRFDFGISETPSHYKKLARKTKNKSRKELFKIKEYIATVFNLGWLKNNLYVLMEKQASDKQSYVVWHGYWTEATARLGEFENIVSKHKDEVQQIVNESRNKDGNLDVYGVIQRINISYQSKGNLKDLVYTKMANLNVRDLDITIGLKEQNRVALKFADKRKSNKILKYIEDQDESFSLMQFTDEEQNKLANFISGEFDLEFTFSESQYFYEFCRKVKRMMDRYPKSIWNDVIEFNKKELKDLLSKSELYNNVSEIPPLKWLNWTKQRVSNIHDMYVFEIINILSKNGISFKAEVNPNSVAITENYLQNILSKILSIFDGSLNNNLESDIKDDFVIIRLLIDEKVLFHDNSDVFFENFIQYIDGEKAIRADVQYEIIVDWSLNFFRKLSIRSFDEVAEKIDDLLYDSNFEISNFDEDSIVTYKYFKKYKIAVTSEVREERRKRKIELSEKRKAYLEKARKPKIKEFTSEEKSIINSLNDRFSFIYDFKKKINLENPSNNTLKKESTYFENYDLYSDADPSDTIRVKYDTLDSLIHTIEKLERLYKSRKYPHNRISQVANVITQRLRVIRDNTGKGEDRYKLAKDYFNFLKERTLKKQSDRIAMEFLL